MFSYIYRMDKNSYVFLLILGIFHCFFTTSTCLFMRNGVEHPTSKASQKRRSSIELSNNISDRSEA